MPEVEHEHKVIATSVTEARSLVRLTVLEETEPGDVFYILGRPGLVWMRCERMAHELDEQWDKAHEFQLMGHDELVQLRHIGTGGGRQRCVIIHNVRSS